MKNHILITTLLCMLPLLGCEKSGEGASKETKSFIVPGLGISVVAPANWKLKQNSEDFYFLKGPGGQVQLVRSTASGGVSLDELGKECSVAVLKKEMLPGGAFFVLCDSERAGERTKAVKAELSTGKSTSVRCQWETGGDPTAMETVCKTLRKAKEGVVQRPQ